MKGSENGPSLRGGHFSPRSKQIVPFFHNLRLLREHNKGKIKVRGGEKLNHSAENEPDC